MRNPANLRASRALLVQKYLVHPGSWPDGIESRNNPWYTSNKEYWDALAKKVDWRGNWIDPQDDPTNTDPRLRPQPVTKNKPVTKNRVTDIQAMLAKRERGRPKKAKAVSAAERMRIMRAKRKGGK